VAGALKFQPAAASPATCAVSAQTLVTLVVVFFASQLFVKLLDAVGPMIGLSASVTALRRTVQGQVVLPAGLLVQAARWLHTDHPVGRS
jgi:hypothetical protein